MPSWVPDWAVGSDQPYRATPLVLCTFNAGGETVGRASLSPSLDVLTVSGYIVDRVMQVSQRRMREAGVNPGSQLDENRAALMTLMECWEEFMMISESVQPYPTGEDPVMLWPRLMVCNQGPGHPPSLSEDLDMFHLYGLTFIMEIDVRGAVRQPKWCD
jgi:hypothetical protein